MDAVPTEPRSGTSGVRVRRAEPTDADRLAVLHLDVWDDAYTGLVPQHVLDDRRRVPITARVARWRTRLGRGDGTWVADTGADLVGFATSGPGRDSDLAGLELMAIYVRAHAYGTGVGHALFEASVGEAPAYLWVLDGNVRAIAFYERHGFAFDGSRKDAPEGIELRMVRR